MTTIDDAQYQRTVAASMLTAKYGTPINRESAHEILQKKLEESAADEPDQFGWKKDADEFDWKQPRKARTPRRTTRRPRQEKSVVEEVMDSRMAQNVARQATRSIVRGLFGMLKGR